MLKVTKFGGSSMADAGQYQKVRDILLSESARKVVVVSAAGKRDKNDHKITDLLYLCHAHTQYGVDCTAVFEMITSRYLEIRDELGVKLDLESEFAELILKHLYIMGMAVSYRDYGMTAVKIGIDLSVLIPKGCIQASYRLDVPQLIYFE